MKRGKNQVLYNFLPGKTFDFEGGRAICRVTNFEAEENTRVNIKYILSRVARLLTEWPENMRRGFPNPYSQVNQFMAAIPRAVEAELFPLLYECTNPSCRRVASYNNIDLLSNTNKNLKCPVCKFPLFQLHHVLIHRCGYIRPFIVPQCPHHGYGHMWLDTRGSQKYAQFRWRCRNCKFESTIISGSCPDCNLQDKRLRPVVHRAGSSYYAHYCTMLNLPGKDLDIILEDPEYHRLAIAAYLGLFEHGPDKKMIDYAASNFQNNDTGEMRTLKNLLKKDDISDEVKKFLKKQIQESSGSQRDNIINDVKDLITLEERDLEEAGIEIMEFIQPDETMKVVTLLDLEEKARKEVPDRLPVYQIEYRKALKCNGLSDVKLIEDFPVTTVVIGYTRDQRDAENTVIRSFPLLKNRDRDGRTPLFVSTTETEALLFKLEPLRVFRWLELNGLVSESGPDRKDAVEVKSWILNRMRAVNPFRPLTDYNSITCNVHGLVHSFSHLVLRQAVIQSGFDRTSLSEYLFPRALSFVIYSNNKASFSIGGLYTLFEQTLHEHLTAVLERGEACVYDPVCMEERGACHACMFISEISCGYFNRNLNRRYLFGNINEDGKEFIGYWDHRCRNY